MQVAPGVRHLLAPNPSFMTGRGTNSYLVGEREVTVVDPGPDRPEHVAAILREVAEAGGRITGLLVTHGHSDHLPGAYRLRERTGAPIVGHPSLPGVDRPLADGEAVATRDGPLVAFDTPGHADDHLCFWREADRLLFSGDLVAGLGTVVLSQQPGSLTQYLASLHRMLDLAPQTILPGHGPVITDARAKLQEYLDHRALRERQLVDVLQLGPASIDELVQRIYYETPAELYRMAARNVQAHLEHLAAQGRASTDGQLWRLNEKGAGD